MKKRKEKNHRVCKSVVSERKKTSSSGKEELSNDDELSETRETPVMISRDPKQKRKHIAKERRNTITATEEEEEGYKRPQKTYIYIYIYIYTMRVPSVRRSRRLTPCPHSGRP